jgi:mRNA interferase MazF
MISVQKYDIVSVDLNPKKGHAQAGIRPCVIIQSNLFATSPTVLLVPLASQKKKIFPSEFLISPSKTNGLSAESRFLGSQIMTLDKHFLKNKMGVLEPEYRPYVREALDVSLDPNDDF